MFDIDRRDFIASLGGVTAVSLMSHDAKADALEEYMNDQLHLAQADHDEAPAARSFPSAAEIEARIPTRHYRRGVGRLFLTTDPEDQVSYLSEMPAAPTLIDFIERRFQMTNDHCLQSANKAMERGADDDIVLACLLHDHVQVMMRSDHGYWGAQLFEPYVPERTAFAIRYHQALRFFADEQAGYHYPDLYRSIFGEDYVPAAHVQRDYEYTRNHRWYDAAREVTVSDLYAFDPNAVVSLDPFVDLIGRLFRQPTEGLGNDNSSVAHMWRTIANPDAPL